MEETMAVSENELWVGPETIFLSKETERKYAEYGEVLGRFVRTAIGSATVAQVREAYRAEKASQ